MKKETTTTSKRKKTFGQQERYMHITKALFNEKLKCNNGSWLRNVDVSTEPSWLAKRVRRIIEKRMCQNYFRRYKDVFRNEDNRSRHNMRRAVSYELYVMGQIENIEEKNRGLFTHWKKRYDPNTQQYVFKKKIGYNTIEEAKTAAKKLSQDERKLSKKNVRIDVYKCIHCNKYHIGHESIMTKVLLRENPILATA